MNEIIEVFLPKNKNTLAFLGLHGREKDKCIALGLSFLSHGNETIQCWDNRQWETKLKHLQQELERERMCNSELITQHKQEKKRLSEVIKGTENARYQADTNFLQDKIALLERRVNQEVDKYCSLHQRLTNDFESRQITREQRYEDKIQELETTVESMRHINDTLSMRGQNSTFLGQDGEKLTCQALNCLFPKAEIIDTHAQGGKGDFLLKEGDICCMIETKNHKANVGRLDIDKFYTDIETNDNIKCGIFASLKSGVVNRGDFHLEFRNKKPILFLTHVKNNMKHLVLALMIFRVLMNVEGLDMSQKEKIDRITHCIPVIKRKWATLRSTITTFQTTMFQLISDQEASIKMLFEL